MIIANTCIGSYCYKQERFDDYRMALQYDNPFVGNVILNDSFYRLMKRFDTIDFRDYRIEQIPYQNSWKETIYNTLILENDIYIYFIHYKSIQQTKDRWDGRVGRMIEIIKEGNWIENTLFSFVSHEHFAKDKEEVRHYENLILTEFPQYNICINKNDKINSPNIIQYPLENYNHTYEVSRWINENYPRYIKNGES